MQAELRAAYNDWEERQLGVVDMVTKGPKPWTEHYSAVQAEVPGAADPRTQLNERLIEKLDRADPIIIACEASSHCVSGPTEHVVENLTGRLGRVVPLTDCMSPVRGFEAQHAAFMADMCGRGVQLVAASECCFNCVRIELGNSREHGGYA